MTNGERSCYVPVAASTFSQSHQSTVSSNTDHVMYLDDVTSHVLFVMDVLDHG